MQLFFSQIPLDSLLTVTGTDIYKLMSTVSKYAKSRLSRSWVQVHFTTIRLLGFMCGVVAVIHGYEAPLFSP